jgi:His/Glu/Gln/Arg/opine family amino acid ABC transporter permease subunit
MNWEALVVHYFPTFLQGLGVTLGITAGSFVLAMVGGLVLALARLSSWWPVQGLALVYVTVIRAVPVLVLLFLVYYVGGQIGVLRLNGAWSGIVTLGLFYAAIYSEIFRGGIQGVERGQVEAAWALGLNGPTRLRRVILPQAIMAILPPGTNQLANLIKDTSLVMTIGVGDLMMQAYKAGANNFQYLDMFLFAGIFYFALYLLVSRGIVRWENRVRQQRYS